MFFSISYHSNLITVFCIQVTDKKSTIQVTDNKSTKCIILKELMKYVEELFLMIKISKHSQNRFPIVVEKHNFVSKLTSLDFHQPLFFSAFRPKGNNTFLHRLLHLLYFYFFIHLLFLANSTIVKLKLLSLDLQKKVKVSPEEDLQYCMQIIYRFDLFLNNIRFFLQMIVIILLQF